MNQITGTSSFSLLAREAGFDPIEERLRTNVRATIEAVFEEELAAFVMIGAPVLRKAIATGTANGNSPAPSEPRRSAGRRPRLRMRLAR